MSMPSSPPPPFSGSWTPPEAYDSNSTETTKPKRQRREKNRAPKEPKPPTRRVANSNRTIGLLLALVVVAGGFVLFHLKLNSVYVVRANAPVSALTPFNTSEISAYATTTPNLEFGAISAKSAKAALAKAQRELKGTVAQYPIALNEQITPALFTNNAVAPTSTSTGTDQRLFAIQADIGAAAAGIRAGSRVDVIALTTSTQPAIAGVILSNVEVVAVAAPSSALESSASSGSSKTSSTSIGGTYVLLIPANEETRLAAVASSSTATLYLTYAGGAAQAPGAATTSVIQAVCGTNDPLHESGSSVQVLPSVCKS